MSANTNRMGRAAEGIGSARLTALGSTVFFFFFLVETRTSKAGRLTPVEDHIPRVAFQAHLSKTCSAGHAGQPPHPCPKLVSQHPALVVLSFRFINVLREKQLPDPNAKATGNSRAPQGQTRRGGMEKRGMGRAHATREDFETHKGTRGRKRGWEGEGYSGRACRPRRRLDDAFDRRQLQIPLLQVDVSQSSEISRQTAHCEWKK